MANILERYGIKEVADVTFYKINDDATQGAPVLYLDTLKVSTIEQTAETSDARGGKGNPKLITWDYGKDITVTLEDALFSAKSLAIMFGNGTVKDGENTVTRTVMARLDNTGTLKEINVDVYDAVAGGAVRQKIEPANASQYNINIEAVYNENSESLGTTYNYGESYANMRVFVTYKVAVKNNKEIVVSADTFPGTYYVTGDTYARSDVTGEDQFFQFIIKKAKVTSENTITLEAEGDPSVFNMNLTVLRPEDGEMMKLVQYDLAESIAVAISGPNEVEVGKSITLTVEGANGNTVEWEADEQGVVEIDEDKGTVTGAKEGTVTITATVNGEVAKHFVRVNAATATSLSD